MQAARGRRRGDPRRRCLALALGVRATHADERAARRARRGRGARRRDEGRGPRSGCAASPRPPPSAADARRRGQAPDARPAQAGYFADLDATADRALESGRDGPLGGLLSTVAGLVAARDVQLAQPVDRRAAAAHGRLGHRPARPAPVRRRARDRPGHARDHDEGAALRSRGRPARASRAPRVGAARRPRTTVEVPLRTQRVATRAAVDAVGSAARSLSGAPLRLTGAGEPLEISPADSPECWRSSRPATAARSVRLGAGDQRLEALVEAIAAKRDRPARNARISAPDSGRQLDAKGDASWRPRAVEVRSRRPPAPAARSSAASSRPRSRRRSARSATRSTVCRPRSRSPR